MPEYKITCCSTADLPPEYFAERDVPLAYYHFVMDGIEYPDDMGKTIPFSDFYTQMLAGGKLPVTSQVNVTTYIALFAPILASGLDVLHLTLSSGITSSLNSALMAQEELRHRFPDRKLYIVDSLAASAGYGMLVDAALDMRDSGKTIDEVYSWVEENKLYLNHWFFATDLKHLHRGGRVSASAAAVGSLLHICPLLNVDNTGHLIPRAKIRGRKNVIRELAEMMKQHARDRFNYSGKCFISNSACYDDAKAVADILEAAFPKLDGGVRISNIGTVIGAHTGAGTVALFFWGDKRTS